MSQNYEKMSDFELMINVAREINFLGLLPTKTLGKQISSLTLDDFDPCNNPSDAWPIIWSNGISIVNDRTCKFATINAQESYEPLGDNTFEVGIDDKTGPLKAAMICFLKMKDDEQ